MAKARSRDCDVAVDLGDPALPVAGTGTLAAIRKSRNSRRRALVLLAVHAAIAAHATHFLLAGRTLSPVEPSEAMYTLELGQLNAGFVFLLVALAATLVFGRFVCGWGCHLIALQDLCGWIMKRLGVRPRPFRSRVLLWAPAALAFYMFFWPSLARIGGAWLAQRDWLAAAPFAPFPGLSNHLVTDAFWKTFPGPLFAVLTFAVCGFAAVYFLGAKGFCTYGCPYGALFGAMDRLALGQIVVSDACEQCGHCSATCTSNVLVHEEVRRYGRVVDPGCMKCMDCVSVCPKGALSFSFARPSILRGRAADSKRVRRFTLGIGEELLVGLVGLGATLAFRKLYGGPSLLMAMGLGGITAFVALKLWQLLRRPTVRVQNLTFKAAGRWRGAGAVFLVVAVAWLAFTAHGGFHRWHRWRGNVSLERTGIAREAALSGAAAAGMDEGRRGAVERTVRHFGIADRVGLVEMLDVKLGLAWAHLLRDEPAAAESYLREALALAPQEPALHDHLVDLYVARARPAEAIAALEEKLIAVGADAADLFRLAGLLVEAGRESEAVARFRASLELAPGSATTHYNLGGLLRRLERPSEAAVELEAAAELAPGDFDTQVELGLAYASLGRTVDAAAAFRRAIEIDPGNPESRLHLPNLIRQLESRLD